MYAENTIKSLVYPILITCGSLLNIDSNTFPDISTKIIAHNVAIAS